MAINVTLGEAKTQTEKPFPKLMIGNKDWIVEIYESDRSKTGYVGIHRSGSYFGSLAFNFNIEGFVDYNEPITLQNA